MGLISADTDLVVNGALIPCKYTKKKILNSMRMMRIINEVYDFRRYRSHVFNLNTENCVFSCLIHMLTYTEILLAEEWTELFVFFQQGKVKRIHVTTTKGGYRRQCIQTPSGMVVRGEEPMMTREDMKPAPVITYTVAECGEFHSQGAYRDDIPTIEEAKAIYDAMLEERRSMIPAVGMKLHYEERGYDDVQWDFMYGNRIDLGDLGFLPDILLSKAVFFSECLLEAPAGQALLVLGLGFHRHSKSCCLCLTDQAYCF